MRKSIVLHIWKTIHHLLLVVLLCNVYIWTTYADTDIQTRLQQLRNRGNSSTISSTDESVMDVRVEIKIEDVKHQDIPEPFTIEYISEGRVMGVNNLWSDKWLTSFQVKLPTTDKTWKITIKSSWNLDKLDKDITFDLDYSKFEWTSKTKNLLYFVQLSQLPDVDKYSLADIYTSLESDRKQEEDQLKSLTINWSINVDSYIRDIVVGLYDKEWKKIIETKTDQNNKFSLLLKDLTNTINLWENYSLIYSKEWDINNNVTGIIGWGVTYNFRNYREVISILSQNITLNAKYNPKDIVQTEWFPYIWTIFLIVTYWLLMSYLFWILIKSWYFHVILSQKKSIYLDESRHQRINDFKQNHGITVYERKASNWVIK